MKLKDIVQNKNVLDYEESDFIKYSIDAKRYRISSKFNENLPSAFIGQAFGAGKEYNKILAQSIIDAKKFFAKDIPIYVQTEIGDCLAEKGEINYTSFGETYQKGETSRAKSKIDTKGILEETRKHINENGLDPKKVLYFAHPAHIFRVMEVGKNIGLEGGVFIPEHITWPIQDSQKWVNGPKEWSKREKLARIHHWLFGYIKREF